jgi:hypothetical protein
VCSAVQVATTCGTDGAVVLAAPVAGYLFALLSAWLSGFAAVYTEYLMKARDDSLYWQNAQLYGFGAIFNFCALTVGHFVGAHEGASLHSTHFTRCHKSRLCWGGCCPPHGSCWSTLSQLRSISRACQCSGRNRFLLLCLRKSCSFWGHDNLPCCNQLRVASLSADTTRLSQPACASGSQG